MNHYLPQASNATHVTFSSPFLSLSLFQSRAWTLSLGFSLAYGAMFSKTWRVHLIFTNKKLKRKVKLENHKNSKDVKLKNKFFIEKSLLKDWYIFRYFIIRSTKKNYMYLSYNNA